MFKNRFVDPKKALFTLVTVVSETDLPFLGLQAKSLDRYLEYKNFVNRIIVIWNEKSKEAANLNLLTKDYYGKLAPMVEFIDRCDINYYPKFANGWATQQVLKLDISRYIKTPYYITLDSKNIIVDKFHKGLFQKGSKLLTYNENYANHPLEHLVVNSLKYHGLELDWVRNFFPTITPLPMVTSLCRNLLSSVESSEDKHFCDFFLNRKWEDQFTEYSMYFAYHIKTNYNSYTLGGIKYPVIWKHNDTQYLLEQISAFEKKPVAVFSVHRAFIEKMDLRSKKAIVYFWLRRKIIKDMFEGYDIIDQILENINKDKKVAA